MATGSGMMVEAFKLLVLGMGFVYLLLGILVLAIKVLGWIAREAPHELPTAATLAEAHLADSPSPATVAAISAAIHRHQTEHLAAEHPEHQK